MQEPDEWKDSLSYAVIWHSYNWFFNESYKHTKSGGRGKILIYSYGRKREKINCFYMETGTTLYASEGQPYDWT